MNDPRLRIAVVGAGVSGLTAAWLLGQRHDVTVFERDDRLGGHAHTVAVEWLGERHAIDTGFIVFNPTHYPLFTAMLAALGVKSQSTSMSFSVRNDDTGLEYNGTSWSGLFAQRRNLARPGYWRFLAAIPRFNAQARRLLAAGEPGDESIGTFLERHRFPDSLGRDYIVPMGSALWSSPPEQFAQFPVRFVAEFLANHALLETGRRPEWRTVTGGSQRYVGPLARAVTGAIRQGSPVLAVRRRDDGVSVLTAAGAERFDEVVLGCHADQAAGLLGPEAPEAAVLAAFPYQANPAVLHTDESVLPDRPAARASWNYRVDRRRTGSATVTYDLTRLQRLPSKTRYLVTLNDQETVSADRVLWRGCYHHPVFGPGSLAARARHAEFVRRDRVSLCGAYWGYGFHEDGVRSAVAVAAGYGIRGPG